MTTPPTIPWDRRPLSLVVLGNSLPLMQVPRRDRHGDGTYPEVLADDLVRLGVPVQLAIEAEWFELAHSGARRARGVFGRYAPDVVIVHYGVNEMMPWLMPVAAVRHLMRQREALARATQAYREHIGAAVWDAAKRYRKWAAPKVGLHTWQLSPHRFRASLDLIIRLAAATTAPLVLVLDINQPGPIMRRYLPGIADRHPIFQQILADAVAAANDPNVRLVRASTITTTLGEDVAMPDSIHWTPTAHRMVAALLLNEIRSWVAQGGHT